MKIPESFLAELRSRLSLADVAGRVVTWDQRRSQPAKGDYWAPCPFHHEKTASFHVVDREGYYYCFGCQAKGDVLSFVRETENLGFREGVERLAGLAGLAMPEVDPRAAAQAEANQGLYELNDAAARFYQRQLSAGPGQAARDTLTRRGVSTDTVAAFGLGYAPGGGRALLEHLTAQGAALADLVRAGLIAEPEDGRSPYDRFRDRIMFPIREERDRTIAFGGRAMAKDARAKYLNSPETPLFDKGRTLYNLRAARARAKDGPLVVAEGYMDVIALSDAGLAAVAPLGTAITEAQLERIWKISGEPVIALDGDRAGLRAAMRLVDLALPRLAHDKSLRFCLLPEGRDPDDVVRSDGAAAMADLIGGAEPLVRLLWRRETEGQTLDSPERRAALDARLRQALGRIEDQGLREHYRTALRDLRSELFRRPERPRWRSNRTPAGPSISTRSSPLAREAAAAARTRESLLLTGCIHHPSLAETFEAELEALSFDASLEPIRQALLHCLGAPDLRQKMTEGLGQDPIATLEALPLVRATRSLGADATSEDAERTLADIFARHRAESGLADEIREAESEIATADDEALTWRLNAAGAACRDASKVTSEETSSLDARARADLDALHKAILDRSGS
ncbi:MAG: DNA primase [Pseudomonadota bacterium]